MNVRVGWPREGRVVLMPTDALLSVMLSSVTATSLPSHAAMSMHLSFDRLAQPVTSLMCSLSCLVVRLSNCFEPVCLRFWPYVCDPRALVIPERRWDGCAEAIGVDRVDGSGNG